jgi:hypothetical protein
MSDDNKGKELSKFYGILTRGDAAVSGDRAERWAKNATKASRRHVETIEGVVDKIKESLANMTDMSTSNDLQTANRVGEFDSDSFVKNIHTAEYDLTMAQLKYTAAKNAHEKYFGKLS